MGLLTELGVDEGYLKAGFFGFQKAGKTWTATALALGTWDFFGRKGRILFADTERGASYISMMVQRYTGKKPLGIRSRALSDLLTVAKNETKPGDVLVVDSITHYWRELCDAHLAKVNEQNEGKARRSNKPFYKRTRLEFQDQAVVKQAWEPWTNWYINSPCHVIICGRAGFEWDRQENEETGKMDLVKVGHKMKTESEFGFEPSLLVEMERKQDLSERTAIYRTATVIGDRFNLLDGAQKDFRPTRDEKSGIASVFDFFRPHIELLNPSAHSEIDTTLKTDTGVTDGESEIARERKAREILCEEIKGELIKAGLDGQSADDKRRRVDIFERIFHTKSWTAIESKPSEDLRTGLAAMRAILAPPAVGEQADGTLAVPKA